MKYVKLDNAFVRLSDVERAQELDDSFERVDWIHVLGRYALRVNPLLRQKGVLHSMQYHWVTAQLAKFYDADVTIYEGGGINSSRSARLRNKMSVEYSDWAVTQ